MDPGSQLNIDLLNGFTPFVGEKPFMLMDFRMSGTFASAPTTGFVMDGFNWTIACNANDNVLDAGSPVTTAPTPEPSSRIEVATRMVGRHIFPASEDS